MITVDEIKKMLKTNIGSCAYNIQFMTGMGSVRRFDIAHMQGELDAFEFMLKEINYKNNLRNEDTLDKAFKNAINN